jgi:hypothetical protein
MLSSIKLKHMVQSRGNQGKIVNKLGEISAEEAL